MNVRHSDPAIMALQVELRVTKHAVATVARYQDDEIDVFTVAEEVTGDEGRAELARIEDYQTFLYEPSRPPSQGGNTSALHVHTIWVEGQKYSFFARGSRQWVFKADRVSFSYRTTEAGYRNIIKQTLATLDKDGRPVKREDRRFKAQLRTAPAKTGFSQRARHQKADPGLPSGDE